MMRIIVAGSRTVTKQEVMKALNCCPWIGFATAIVSGTAKGADMFGEMWAKEQGIEIHRYPADWNKYGKRAGPLRNENMANNADGLVAIWDGMSRGTYSMVELARKHGLRISILRTDLNTIEEHSPTGYLLDIWETAEERAAIKEHDAGLPRLQAEREAATHVLAEYLSKRDGEVGK